MKSGADNHFPPVVFRHGKRLLWNRLQKRPLADRPEERVRLRYIDYLTLECGWPASRIASESTLDSASGGPGQRADLVCHDDRFLPRILIECKAENVRITEQSAMQIARYNRHLGASLLCLTNGREDHWFEIARQRALPLSSSPLDPVHSMTEIRSAEGYWRERGFCGSPVPDAAAGWTERFLTLLWEKGRPWNSLFIPFGTLEGIDLSHHYRVAEAEGENRIAFTLLGDGSGDTWLAAVLDRNGHNCGFILASLHRAAAGDPDNGVLHRDSGSIRFDLRDLAAFGFESLPEADRIASLPGRLTALFDF